VKDQGWRVGEFVGKSSRGLKSSIGESGSLCDEYL